MNISNRAILLVRVSSKQQRDNTSFETQEQVGTAYADRNGLEIVAVYRDAESGASLDRSGLTEARAMLRRGVAQHLIVYNQDRWSRDLADSVIIAREFQQHGIFLHFALENRVAWDNGDLIWLDVIHAVQAQKERETLLRRTSAGRAAVQLSERYVGNGAPPYGYRREGSRKTVTLALVDDEARVVADIYRWFVQGDGAGPLGVAAIVERLNALRIPTPADRSGIQRKRRAFGEWNATAVYDLLHHPVYSGRAVSNRYQMIAYDGQSKRRRRVERPQHEWRYAPVPAVVSLDLWEAAQEKVRRGSELNPRNRKHDYLVGRRITCACGYRVQGVPAHDKGKAYLYYGCNGRDKSITSRRCTLPRVRVDLLDGLVWQWVCGLLLDPDQLQAELLRQRTMGDDVQRQRDGQRRVLIEAIAELDQQLQRLLNLYLRGSWDAAHLDQQKAELEQQRTTLQARADELETPATPPLTDAAIETVTALAEELRPKAVAADFETRRFVIDILDVTVMLGMEPDGCLYADMQSIISTQRLQVYSGTCYSCPCRSHRSRA